MDCRNSSILVNSLLSCGEFVCGVHSPLYPDKGVIIAPPPPFDILEDDACFSFGHLLSKEGSGGVVYLWFSMEFDQFPQEIELNQQAKATGHVYLLQDGDWHIHTSATIQLPKMLLKSMMEPYIVLVHDKIYMAATSSNFLVLDMASSSFSTVELPDGLVHGDGKTMLSPADDSGVFLIHMKGLQLNIWLHRGDNGSVNSWLLVDTICLREMCTNLKMSNQMTEGDHTVVINEVGNHADFVFLEMGESVLYLDLKSRELRKVYEQTEKERRLERIHPFLMMWPPIFPILRD